MPIFEYECRACADPVFTRLVHCDERDEQTCNRCGRPLERLPSHPAFRIGSLEYRPTMADRATADILGYHSPHELDPGLRTGKGKKKE